ncbi:threonine-phosphate decarboxylase CobD [Oricola cellulosilytica]|uniref:threonine-phosphate decarboxylase n=1 Tax=Oricola cellulosilytica TaxID=1429082 RepID=A0A4R0PCJ6_9HYPH|nr:threonine-phosphate decarboxylase CobD [Oricola cellulosilytica]TCD15006.1 threonine-phosphate decarboxylase [Oricola cellulosilytica]
MEGLSHGGALDRAIAQHGGCRADWLDLSTGINPVPYPVPDIPTDVWHRLPDEGLVSECLAAARDFYRVPKNAGILAAPGTQAIIQWLPLLFNYLDDVCVVSPAYGEYARVFRNAGAHVTALGEMPGPEHTGGLLIFGQPNNPDGRQWPAEQASALSRNGFRMVVADEAFCDITPAHSLVPYSGKPGLLVLRSFGKFFGLAGMRLGFAIGDPDVIESLGLMLGPWAAPGPALHLATMAFRDGQWIDNTRARLGADRERLATIVQKSGMAVVGGTDLFVLANHDKASSIAGWLAEKHILVRSFEYNATWLRFGLPGSEDGFVRLESALAELALRTQ